MPTEQEIRERFSELTDKWCEIITDLCSKAYDNAYKIGYEIGKEEGYAEGYFDGQYEEDND